MSLRYMHIFEEISKHGIINWQENKSFKIKGKKWLIYNRAGVTVIYNILKYNNKINPIDNIIYIINDTFHGISGAL